MQLVKHLLSTLKNYFISVVVEDVLYTEVHSQFLVLTGQTLPRTLPKAFKVPRAVGWTSFGTWKALQWIAIKFTRKMEDGRFYNGCSKVTGCHALWT